MSTSKLKRFHSNSEGNVGVCRATAGRCPFGGDEKHFNTEAEARANFEKASSFLTFGSRIPHKMVLSSEIEGVLETLSIRGAQPNIVGGAVRDSVASGAAPKDVDVEVFGVSSMDELQNRLEKKGYKVDAVGKSFGVLKVFLKRGLDVDVSLPRKDNLTGKGHRGFTVEVDPSLSLEEASGRRDFTINAMYYDHSEGVILDPHGGFKDWEKRNLRHINDSFGEDPLRVLRGVQFSGRFGMKLDPSTIELSKSMVDEFHELPKERIQEEFGKLFEKSPVVSDGLRALKLTGWDKPLGVAELDIEKVSKNVDYSVERARKEKLDVGFAASGALIKDLPRAEQERVLDSILTGDKRQFKALSVLESNSPSSAAAKDVKAWGRTIAKDNKITVQEFLTIRGNEENSYVDVEEVAKSTNSYSSPNADLVTGKMVLQASGGKGGPWVGELLKEANESQDREVFTDSNGAQEWLQNKLK